MAACTYLLSAAVLAFPGAVAYWVLASLWVTEGLGLCCLCTSMAIASRPASQQSRITVLTSWSLLIVQVRLLLDWPLHEAVFALSTG